MTTYFYVGRIKTKGKINLDIWIKYGGLDLRGFMIGTLSLVLFTSKSRTSPWETLAAGHQT